MIQVWHLKNTRLDAPVTFSPEHYTHVANIRVGSLDNAYHLSQSMDQHWSTYAGVRALVPAYRLRSTSMGDVLVNDSRAYLVVAVGFDAVTPETVITWQSLYPAN